MNETVISRIAAAVLIAKDKNFLVYLRKDKVFTVTFSELWDNAARYAATFLSSGINEGDVVAIALRHLPDVCAAFVGAIRAGAIPTLMPFPTPKQDPSYFWDSHVQLFTSTNIKAYLTYEEIASEAFARLEKQDFTIIVNEHLLTAHGDAPPDRLSNSIETVFLQHSSGTTGLKKGVMLTNEVVIRQIDDYKASLGFSEADIVASWLPPYHDMGLFTSILLPLTTGSTVIALDPFEWVSQPTRILDVIQEYRATFSWMPNFAFQHIVNSTRKSQNWDLLSVRALISCSEPCRVDTFDRFIERFRPCGISAEKLQISYAMAETVFAVTQSPLNTPCYRIQIDLAVFRSSGKIIEMVDDGWWILSCGPPLPGCRVWIVNEDGVELESEEVGEVVIGGAYLFQGYNNRPEITAERLRRGRYYTRDLGFLFNGELFITGRKDDLIINYGRNFYAHEIEGCLVGIEGLIPGRSVALGVSDSNTGSQAAVIIAEVEMQDRSGIQSIIKRRVSERLDLIIQKVALVERGWLVKTTSGKISRELNLKKYLDCSEL